MQKGKSPESVLIHEPNTSALLAHLLCSDFPAVYETEVMSSDRRGQGEINGWGEQQRGVWQRTDSASFAGHCWDLLWVHRPGTGLNLGDSGVELG